ncbi:MAG TPA: ComEC/Rec2 family competence protein [Beutenbergiaceae bacterium]|nr:ComEC/Rec2 family competence protein [Beutenbergiaceae bacterium]
MTSADGLDGPFEREPLDLRLLPGALCSWLGCWWLIAAGPGAGLLLTGAILALSLPAARMLKRPVWGRHRRPMRNRLTATVLLTALICGSVLGLSTIRVAERGEAIEEWVGQDVSAVVEPVAEAQQLLSGTRERYRLPARLLAVHSADGSNARLAVPVLILADATWSDVRPGTQWWVRGRVAPTEAGDAMAALFIAEPGALLAGSASWSQRTVATLRAGLVDAAAPLAPQARGLVPGISLGDTRAMPAPLGEDLRAVSLTHITAVSGAHVAIVLGVVLLCVWWLPVWLRAGIAVVVLIGFVALVYPSGSVVRAATMATVTLFGLATGRPRSSVPALFATVPVLLAGDPWLARDFGFTLSVLATGGLLLMSGPISAQLSRVLPAPLAMAAAIPIAAQLACAPVIVLLTPGVATHGVLANVLAAPMVPPATIAGVLATVSAPLWPGAAAMLAQLAAWCTAWIATVATTVADLPLATTPWPEGVAGAAALAAALVAVGTLVRTRRRRLG